jgi:hypothetical protein
MIQIRPNIPLVEAMKVDQLCNRVLGDIGSIHARIAVHQDDGSTGPMSPELIALRRHVREISDAVRDTYPDCFYK